MKVIGIDLGVAKNKTGICVLNKEIKTYLVSTNKEIVEIVKKERPKIVAIDAPLCFPSKGRLRSIEKELIKLKIRFFPPKGMKAMEALTRKAIRLKRALKDFKVIEVYPGAALDIWKIKRNDKKAILRFLRKQGMKVKKTLTKDEIDACISALLAKLHAQGKTFVIGKKAKLVLPKVKNAKT